MAASNRSLNTASPRIAKTRRSQRDRVLQRAAREVSNAPIPAVPNEPNAPIPNEPNSAAPDRRPEPAGKKSRGHAPETIHNRKGRSMPAERERLPFKGGKCRKSPQNTGNHQRPQIGMHQLPPVEIHQQQPDQKRARNIDQKRGQRKPAGVAFINAERDQK